jgi:hypothetical protein
MSTLASSSRCVLHASYTPLTRLLHVSYTPLTRCVCIYVCLYVSMCLTRLFKHIHTGLIVEVCDTYTPLARLLHASYTPLTRLITTRLFTTGVPRKRLVQISYGAWRADEMVQQV